jgi:hypothetical protein
MRDGHAKVQMVLASRDFATEGVSHLIVSGAQALCRACALRKVYLEIVDKEVALGLNGTGEAEMEGLLRSQAIVDGKWSDVHIVAVWHNEK